jgi:hypothetical protein
MALCAPTASAAAGKPNDVSAAKRLLAEFRENSDVFLTIVADQLQNPAYKYGMTQYGSWSTI